MSTALWWIGDAILLSVVLPVILLLLGRIIRPLMVGHRALVSISSSSRSITTALPPGLTELSAMARTAAELPHPQPARSATR